jgi:hypothetical protein
VLVHVPARGQYTRTRVSGPALRACSVPGLEVMWLYVMRLMMVLEVSLR